MERDKGVRKGGRKQVIKTHLASFKRLEKVSYLHLENEQKGLRNKVSGSTTNHHQGANGREEAY